MSVDKKHLPQSFPFSPSILNHIYKNVSGDIVWKLYQSCKFFFIKFRPVIANNLRIVGDSIDLDGNILTLDEFNNVNKNFIFIKISVVFGRLNNIVAMMPNKIIPCFCDCMIFDIQNLTFGIFKKIVECTEILRLSNTKIYFSDDTIAHFEDILPCIPNAYFIYIFKCCYVSPRTEKMLPLIKRNPKFSTFEINYIEGDVDTDKFWEFVVKNIQPRARVEICWGYPEIM